MTEPQTTWIKSETPRREWLLRCTDNGAEPAVCAITVNNGNIDIFGPGDLISLDAPQIADFHAALHEAIELAEADLRGQVSLDQSRGLG